MGCYVKCHDFCFSAWLACVLSPIPKFDVCKNKSIINWFLCWLLWNFWLQTKFITSYLLLKLIHKFVNHHTYKCGGRKYKAWNRTKYKENHNKKKWIKNKRFQTKYQIQLITLFLFCENAFVLFSLFILKGYAKWMLCDPLLNNPYLTPVCYFFLPYSNINDETECVINLTFVQIFFKCTWKICNIFPLFFFSQF